MSLPFLQPYTGLGNSLQTAQAGGAGGAVGGWVELARTTLGSAVDDITVGSLADKRYYMVLVDGINTGGIDPAFRLNADTGTNYANRRSENGGSDATNTSLNRMALYSALDTPYFQVGYLANFATKEKLFQGHLVGRNSAGAGNAPKRGEFVGKHAQTTNPISSVTQRNNGTGDHSIGAEVVVLGWDPADTHTTNFWEELADVNATGSESSFDTGAFTAKKYLCIQFYWKATFTGAYTTMRVGNTTLDTGSNYAWRLSNNGGADGTGVNKSDGWYPVSGQGSDSATDYYVFGNMFIINNASNEKLGICHTNRWDGAGAGNANARSEVAVKWADTTNQIDIVGLERAGGSASGNYDSVSQIKVWGSN